MIRASRGDLAKGALTYLAGFLVLCVLVVLGTSFGDFTIKGMLPTIIALAAAVGLLLLIAFGPDRLGLALLVVAMVMSPMNGLRVTGGNVTFSDLFLVAGLGLLLPRMLQGRQTLPPLYVTGALILLLGGLVSSLLAPVPLASVLAFARIGIAVLFLPVVMNVLHLDRRFIDVLAWSFVAGQLISIGYAIVTGDNVQGRSYGLARHFNFFSIGGQMAFALLVYLFYRTPRKHRWIVVGIAAVIGQGVIMSGSRAGLICCAVVVILWPLAERSAMAWYLVVAVGAVLATVGKAILDNADPESALGRIQGGSLSASYSSMAREGLLKEGWKLFWDKPVQGNGWAGVLEYHNAYLEVAIGGGVLTLVGFLFVMASFIRPLFDPVGHNRLAYQSISYAVFGLLGPTLYDRIVWLPLALVFAIPYAGMTPGRRLRGEPGAHSEANAEPAGTLVAAPAGRRAAVSPLPPRRPR